VFAGLPRRFSKAALLRNFPRPASQRILERFSLADGSIKEVDFDGTAVAAADEEGRRLVPSETCLRQLEHIRHELAGFFAPAEGFGQIVKLNYVDGLRVYFRGGDVAHVRPSGNADELRIYAVADTLERAAEIARLGVAEPDGMLRRLEKTIL
jgi:phosphomannomutase